MRAADLTGLRFGRLLVTVRVPRQVGDGPHARWEAVCDCGVRKVVNASDLKHRGTVSCGCYRAEMPPPNTLTHGHARARSATYNTWDSMVQRTTNPRNPNWPYYGGRGITVCDRWRTFASFLADMGERPAGLTLDRVDNDRGYEPGNCRWATKSEQQRNQRRRNVH